MRVEQGPGYVMDRHCHIEYDPNRKSSGLKERKDVEENIGEAFK